MFNIHMYLIVIAAVLLMAGLAMIVINTGVLWWTGIALLAISILYIAGHSYVEGRIAHRMQDTLTPDNETKNE